MTFQPRINENGRVCCSVEYALCDKCSSYFASRTASVGSVRVDYTPPKPYAAQLEQIQKEKR